MCESLESMKTQLTNIEREVFTDELVEEHESDRPGWHNMPVEIILKICSFLDPQFLNDTLSKVCQRFHNILADDHLWRYWVHSKIKGYYPTISELKLWDEEPINWKNVCLDMDVERKKWTNVKDTMIHIVVKDVHFASVDTVLLINDGRMCVSGGRDRGMALWNVMDIKPHFESDNVTTFAKPNPRAIKHDAHEGWVWDLATDDYKKTTKIYSASWDNTVKLWDLTTGLDCVEVFRCSGMAALSVVTVDHEVMAGLYSRKVLSFDPRVGSAAIYSYKPHGGPVLALQPYNNLLASLSEDKSMAMWDRRARKLLYNIKIPNAKAFPVCISWTPTALYLGDSKGKLHLYNPETHKYIKSFEIWPESTSVQPVKIIGCHQSNGNMITCSDKGYLKFYYNSYPPQEYTCIQSSTFDITQMRYLNGVLVVSTCDSALELWIPNEQYPDL